MKATDLLALLTRKPLRYRITRQRGSHRMLEADYYGIVRFSYHDGRTVPPGVVRKILVNDVGLSESRALDLLYGRW